MWSLRGAFPDLSGFYMCSPYLSHSTVFILSYYNEVDIANLQLMWVFLSLLYHFSSDPSSWEVERGFVWKMRSSDQSLLCLHFWQYIQEQFIRDILSWLFFPKGARQVYSFFQFQMLCFVRCHLPVLLSGLLTWLQCKCEMRKFKLVTWTGQVPNNLTLSQISIFTFHASFPPYHSRNIFTLMLPLPPLPIWLLLSCFIHLLFWCFFQPF